MLLEVLAVVVVAFVSMAFGWFGHVWLSSLVPDGQSDDKPLVRARSIGSAAQARFEHYRTRCTFLEGDLKALNHRYDALLKQYESLKDENAYMAGLLKDVASVNSCKLHGNQAYLATRVQYLKGCGLNVSEIQERIFGYRGGSTFYDVRRLYDGDVTLRNKAHVSDGATDVDICTCNEADWKASQTI